MTTKQNELGSLLWKIADSLRGSMMADDFRDYMLSFLFLKYLSDNYIAAAQKELGKDFPDGDSSVALRQWCKRNADDLPMFENQMRRKIHYVIKPKFLWGYIASLAKTQDGELLKTLEDGFKYIENESFDSSFKGLFSDINLNSDKLGKNYADRNKLLAKIISTIEENLSSFSNENDSLGDAYEFLIGKFAAGSGQKAGEFYTPQEISSILSKIVTLDCHNPKTGKRKYLDKVLDFTCGSGSLLLNVCHEMPKGSIGKVYGQEKNVTTYNLARMNMLLHGLKDSEFEIFHGDTLTNDWGLLNEPNPAKKIEFDAIVANPPFSLRWEPNEETAKDFRFSRYGVAPKSAADFAFLLHGFHFLKEDGTMAIILPHGVLFRTGKEEEIRKKLLKDDNIDAIIGLPANLFYSTGIPVCVIVLKKCRKNENILFINASSEEHYKAGRRQNELRDEDVQKIVETYQYRKEELRYSREVSMREIEENDYNLNISRYVSLSKEEILVDLDDVASQMKETDEKIASARKKCNEYLRELDLPLI